MRKFKTKFGIMYIEKAHKKEPFKYVLLDSDKNWFRNIYDKRELKTLKKYKNFIELVENEFGWCCYTKTLEELVYVVNEAILEDWSSKYLHLYEAITLEEIKNNEYLNHIGDYYIFFLE